MVMKLNMVDLKGQYNKIREEVNVEIQKVLDTTAFINGPKVKEFAFHLAEYNRVKHVIPCGNGTDALQIALMALGLKPGDVIGEMTACDLRQTKHFCQYIYCRNFRTCKLRKTFLFQLFVQLHGFRFQFYRADFLGNLRQIQTFCLSYTIGNGMQFLQEFIHHLLSENRNVIAVSAHIEITTAKSIEACPENLFVQKAVLGKDIQFFVGNECTGQKQFISRLIPQMVHGFGLRCTIFFDLMCLICYDKVGMKL